MTKSTSKVQLKGRGLGDTELVLLSAGSARSDRLVDAPQTMKPVTRQRPGANLIKRGFAEERAARPGEPIWREHDDERFVLMVTPAGLAAIGIEDAGPAPRAATADQAHLADPVQPRKGSKGALLVSMLTRREGASVDELMAATGWLPHTTRAALTGLRKRGFQIGRETGDGGSRYRVATPEPQAAPTRRGRKPKVVEARAAA